ncbi:MAG: pyridoxal-phosphate dependent enzyme [Chitinophagia bacterium]
MTPKPSIQSIPSFGKNYYQMSVLRLDQIHPIVSGNKWYKLKYHLQEAFNHACTTIASFGGPYSNHLVALAYAAQENKLKSIGYVRANNNEPLTPSLQDALSVGMQLVFIGRTHFQETKNELLQKNNTSSGIYFIDEGGYGAIGAKGAADILDSKNTATFDTVICAVGTGTMLAGIINAAAPHQQIIGIPVLKNENSLAEEINTLVINKQTPWTLLHQFHQGGYAKTTPALIQWMNEFWDSEKIPTDIVYTGKLLFAVKELMQADYFKPHSKILIIHSGGLQGNRSLPKNTLLF